MDPKISIITVVRNGKDYIEQTIQSIVEQTYSNIEYIIIDGKSTDGTVDIIKKYNDFVNYWISEPDKGIYDAMNKGVAAASGDWLLFINADDYLSAPNSLSEAAQYLRVATTQIVYGNIVYLYPSGNDVFYAPEWDSVKHRFRNVAMYLAHQATFHSSQLFKSGQFDTSFRIAGDYDFLLRHLKNHEATHIPVTIAKMRAGGLSYSVSKIELLSETRRVQLKNGIYKFLPGIPWIVSATKVVVVDRIIRIFGVDGKDKIKKLLGK